MACKGKVAVVTGANSGIGLATAQQLAEKGATVVIACRSTDKAKEAADEIRAKVPAADLVLGAPLDLMSQDSVRAFAADLDRRFPSIHILVNNAGVSFMKRCFTDANVGGIAQTNHLGPYTLTRLLERKLVASRARVVTVASITHRITTIPSAKDFLREWKCGYYQHTKLANVLFGYELQRRLGPLGLQSVVADPGGVRSGIWDKSPAFRAGLKRKIIELCYSPPEDGCQPVVHAATAAWEKDRKISDGTPVMPDKDLRYYSRGLFNWPILTNFDGLYGKGYSLLQSIKGVLWGLDTLLVAHLDYPLRRLSGGRLCATTKPVRSSTQSYDAALAAELWDASAEAAGLPLKPQV